MSAFSATFASCAPSSGEPNSRRRARSTSNESITRRSRTLWAAAAGGGGTPSRNARPSKPWPPTTTVASARRN
eukprot:3167247-Pyramimonas_sp.AAC.1